MKGEIIKNMNVIKKIISIICSLIAFLLALVALIGGLQCIGADGLDRLGMIFIMPSLFALLIIILDFFVTIEKIKKALVYSCISTLIKIGSIALFIPSIVYSYKYESSNLDFYSIIVDFLILAIIPSAFNILKLISVKNGKYRE